MTPSDSAESPQRPGSPGDPADAESADARATSVAGERESEWVRRRRLAAVFGDVVPEQTSDDAGARGGKGDDWYREQVPPHHG